MRCCQCLFLTLVIGWAKFHDASAAIKVTRSADESLCDPGTYIVHFKDIVTDVQLHEFAKQLSRRSDRKGKLEALTVTEYTNIKCLTARLSVRALQWVSITHASVELYS